MSRMDHIRQFHDLLMTIAHRVGGARHLADCSGRMSWPERGVYFFMERGEVRTHSGTGNRVVRVGTHALRAGASSTLWGRLRQHKGKVQPYGGTHRVSVFRGVVGKALIRRHSLRCTSWGAKYRPRTPPEILEAERPMERTVSNFIGRMPFLWLAVDDAPGPSSKRGFIERNAIALLSNYRKPPMDPPSLTWLGNSCPNERMRESGLWNSNHADEDYDPAFLLDMKRSIDRIVR